MTRVQLTVLPALFRDQIWHIQLLTLTSLLKSPTNGSASPAGSGKEFGLARYKFVRHFADFLLPLLLPARKTGGRA